VIVLFDLCAVYFRDSGNKHTTFRISADVVVKPVQQTNRNSTLSAGDTIVGRISGNCPFITQLIPIKLNYSIACLLKIREFYEQHVRTNFDSYPSEAWMVILRIRISQGSVATHLMLDGSFCDGYILGYVLFEI